MHRRAVIAAFATALAIVVVAGPARAQEPHGRHGSRPDTIDLPAGFQGEGVDVGTGTTFYAGSRADGRIARGDLRAGTSEVLVAEPAVVPAIGLDADVRHGLLWVAGGPSGRAAAYDLRTGSTVAAFTLTTAPSFVNDVVSTRDAAYFTNSVAPEIYRVPVSLDGVVGEPETIPLLGPAGAYVADAFNLNGIEATRDGEALVVVNSTTGQLFSVGPTTGESATIDVGAATFPTGDGLLLEGRTLYVLQNGNQPGVPNQIAVVRLDRDLGSGRLVGTITSPLFETATTLARRGDTIVAVNAQFAGAPIDPEAEVVLLRAHGR